jgi:hypothetical protein
MEVLKADFLQTHEWTLNIVFGFLEQLTHLQLVKLHEISLQILSWLLLRGWFYIM